MTAFGRKQQGVGLFLVFGKCLESQWGMGGTPRHHPGWGPNHRTAECKKVILFEWKLLLLRVHRARRPVILFLLFH